jgi:hypothetical protein
MHRKMFSFLHRPHVTPLCLAFLLSFPVPLTVRKEYPLTSLLFDCCFNSQEKEFLRFQSRMSEMKSMGSI